MDYEELAIEALKKWPDLDPARVLRALRIARKPGMIYNAHCPPGEFDVRASRGNAWYHVNTRAHTCTCKDSKRGNICKHRLAVWLFVQIRTRTAAQVRRAPQAQLLKELGY